MQNVIYTIFQSAVVRPLTPRSLRSRRPSPSRGEGQLLLIACLILAGCTFAQDAANRAHHAGELFSLKNHRVLRLHGPDIRERGFAHGYLLAEEIRDDLDAALKSLPMFDATKYETKLLPWAAKHFEWDNDAIQELDGIFEGMSGKLGKDGLVSKSLNRELTRQDLNALNVLADYFGPACSGFSVWDKRSSGGAVLQGRTLDFPIGPKAIADQLIVVSEAMNPELAPTASQKGTTRKAWVCIGWPGLIVQFSGMNSDGLVACIHDGYNTVKGNVGEACLARGLLLRRMLESIDPTAGDPAATAARMAGAQATACGNLFHLSWPRLAAEKTATMPSAVLEFDSSDHNVSIRRMDESGTLVVTNHFCQRRAPVVCERFKNITDGLKLLENAKQRVGLNEARKLLMSAEQPVAAHSVYFYPDTVELHIALTRNNIMSPHVAPTAFSFKELFEAK